MQIAITSYTATSCLGHGVNPLSESIRTGQSGLRYNDFDGCDLDTWIGRVNGVESIALPPELADLESRNNQLTMLGLQQDGFLEDLDDLVKRVGKERIGIVMATSTSNIGRTEEGYSKLDENGLMPAQYQQQDVHHLHGPGVFISRLTGLTGPSLTISTACSSSAKVFATAARWIRQGVVDAALVGGIDSLCLSVLYGFNSLELLSPEQCRPFDARRDGINIAEAAGFALLERKDLTRDADLMLLGYGESSDAYHMSHPHPEGKGAMLAMTQALKKAGLSPNDVDYINLHGTASKANDMIENLALDRLFTTRTLASSTKGWTGHTLGTAGILETVITLEAMKNKLVPGTLRCEQLDPEFAFPILTENTESPVKVAMTNSFGFGGNNASLVFGWNND
jgi:3-oxoacyl-[acyl-carrier-protein] synthase-1